MLPDTYIPALLRTSSGKRPCGAEGISNDFIRAINGSRESGPTMRVKRERRRDGVLEAVESTCRFGQKPTDWTPTITNDKSGAAGCGEGVLASLIAHEVYH